jgi:hypothetical protein
MGASDQARSVDTVLKFSTSREQGLGDALPAGTVRVYMRDARGQPQFIGESGIGHTPMGSQLGLKTGEAFDVKVKPTVDSREKISLDEWKTTERFRIVNADGSKATAEAESLSTTTFWRTRMSYRVTNARPQPVTVDLVQAGLSNWWDDTRIVEESLKSERPGRDRALWHVEVPANGTTIVTATFETRY